MKMGGIKYAEVGRSTYVALSHDVHPAQGQNTQTQDVDGLGSHCTSQPVRPLQQRLRMHR